VEVVMVVMVVMAMVMVVLCLFQLHSCDELHRWNPFFKGGCRTNHRQTNELGAMELWSFGASELWSYGD
jgi:hypothetical protein